MATFTSLGVGSGLDLNTIVTKLVALERQPLTQMQSQASRLQTQVSAFGKINALMAGLQTASNALTTPTLWSQSAVTSSDPAVVSVVAGGGVAAGNYAVSVSQLAASQTLASDTFASAGSAVGSGTLSIELGSWNADLSAFAPKVGAAGTSIAVSSSDTVQTLAQKINEANAGVTASLVTDSSGVRLSLRSSDTGAANGFRINAADSSGNPAHAAGNLSFLAFDPPSGATANHLMQGAADARARINGIEINSASNAVSGAIEGLTLNLNKLSPTAVNVAASADRAGVQTAVKNFASAYNAMIGFVNDQTKYDAASKSGGVLQGDSAATNLQERLRAMVGASSGASAKFRRLSDIGLEVQRDGTLSVNATKLETASADLVELKKAFSNSDANTPANTGFARRYAQLASSALGVDGTITTRTEGLRKLISKNGEEQTALNVRVDSFQQRLVAQYTALDRNVAKLNALSSYVTQQVTQWSNQKN